MGYAATANIAPDTTSDATFRAWGSAISAKFASMGLIQTADTGQINWTTVTKPGSSPTAAGYEMWRFNDALQATLPVFIKVEYGLQGATTVGMWFTIGIGSNGSGTVIGGSARTSVSVGVNSTTALVCVFSGATNRVGMVLFKNLSNAGNAVFIERGKASDGSDNNLISFVWWEAARATGAMTLGNQLGSWTTAVATTNMVAPEPTQSRTSGLDGASNVCVYANMHSNSGGWYNALMTHVAYFNGDIVQDSTFVVSIYGNPHTYYAIGGAGNYIVNVSKFNVNTSMRMAMLYE